MQILAVIRKPRYLTIRLVRINYFTWGIACLAISIYLGISLVAKASDDKKFIDVFALVYFIVVSFLISYKYSKSNIVYLSKGEICLQGVFTKKYFPIEEFNRLSYYSPFLELLYIEFRNGDRYHVIVRQITNPIYRNVFKNDKALLIELTKLIENYR